MRPPKVIMLIDSTQMQASCYALVLDTLGYRVLSSTLEGGFDERTYAVDLVLAHAPVDESTMARLVRDLHCGGIVIGPASKDEVAALDLVKLGPCIQMSELLDRIRILAARKRSPRPRVFTIGAA